ncbi:N-acetylmuramoyl-L-alanine amidase [Porticoccus sp. W117]|uniref:N-acetylmuramoyl-L-alanine amidase n=1 Tax=Porticoccus sp. W117 TaxID=3054777 RepID=UPI0025989B1C|nr:N-acetylmuramoyl-L-alanine amidase [Porticoccus sp. W117]MDM3871560.1 N-acetylmuramoyl-L-alanine amidase [Porticoccus sp. W117]
MLKRRITAQFVFLWLLLCSVASTASTVDGVRVWRSPDNTRLVFDLSAAVDHRIFTLENPSRLVIDIEDATSKTRFDKLPLSNTPVSAIRSAAKKGGDLRVVLDLGSVVSPRSFTLKPNKQYGHRLVIDLYDKAKAAKTVKTISDAVKNKERDIVIAIDAGHGGEDPGALGKRGIHEKHVALAISKELKRIVDRAPGFRGELVRSGDYYIPLKKRRDIAHRMRADLFVSVHANSFTSPKPRGASVYVLSTKGATSEMARYLARKENSSDLIGGVENVSLKDKDDDLARVLLDLSMDATLNSSLDVASEVLKGMGRISKLHQKNTEQANFVVLRSPDMPSILVETGFISNPSDRKLLVQSGFQKKMANAIFTGVQSYFYKRPLEGTWLAANRNKVERTYVIGRGDTLSEIAQRHKVSVKRLMSYNGLKSSRIRMGQRLKIPAS